MPLAAARQILFGKTLYRDIWFDKPPLVPMIYLLWGVRIGVVLRVAGAVYCGLVSWLAYGIARALWSEHEGRWAAILMAFFLTFDTPSAALPLAADSLLIAPHLLAILLAIQGRRAWSGIAAGIGFLFNTKALFVLASCAVFAGSGLPLLLAGFLLPCVLALGVLEVSGAWQPYLDQVWIWSSAYARNTFVERPFLNGLVRTANWSGFHLALLISGRAGRSAGIRTKNAAANLQLADMGRLFRWPGSPSGWRFFPRYYFQLPPFAVIAASRGMTLLDAGAGGWLRSCCWSRSPASARAMYCSPPTPTRNGATSPWTTKAARPLRSSIVAASPATLFLFGDFAPTCSPTPVCLRPRSTSTARQ